MMQNYYFYIYPDINGNYEVHTENCYTVLVRQL